MSGYLPRVDDTCPRLDHFFLRDPGEIRDVSSVEARVSPELLPRCCRFWLHGLAAADPAAALTLSDRHPGPIHLLLTDVVMPEMSGRELRQRLKSLRPRTRVLYMSGYTDEALGRHGVLEPGTYLLQKPFRIGALGLKVREVLDAPD